MLSPYLQTYHYNKTIDICINGLYGVSDEILSFRKPQLHKLLSLAATDCFFIFNEKVYKQKDGVAMGNPLGPTLANAFLAYHEVRWLNDCPLAFKPLLYRRYVDDTFLIFKSSSHIPLFLEYLNSKHENITFTSETETNGKLAFLDVLIKRDVNGFQTEVYRKPTFTGLTSKFSSFIPVDFKRNLVKTLVTRAFYICSDYFSLHFEFSCIKEILYLNGFNTKFTDTYLGKQLNKLISPCLKKATVNRATVYFLLPYMGRNSYSLRNKLNKLLQEFYPQVHLKVIFKPKNIMKNLFQFKDKVPKELQSSVVYKYICSCCNASYIGKSKRQFQVRAFEHLGRSIRTNRPLNKLAFSAIRDHSHQDHPLCLESFSILASSRTSDTELTILESLFNIKEKPSLNNNERSVELLCF